MVRWHEEDGVMTTETTARPVRESAMEIAGDLGETEA